MPVEQRLVGAEQERARAACRIENPELLRLPRGLAIEQLAHRLLDDVVDDVGGRVVDAAGLLDLGFVLHYRTVALGESNYLA